MGDGTGIEWTDATWNPIRGCTRVSEGCRSCYAEVMAARFSGPGQPYDGLASRSPARWTGVVRLIPEKLVDPLRWTRPRKIFVNSMSDLFHERVEREWVAGVLGVIARAPRHTFQVLTKRPERMRQLMDEITPAEALACMSVLNPETCREPIDRDEALRIGESWPPRNLWLGTSVENQSTYDERIGHLVHTRAARRFISYEPALGEVFFQLDKNPPGERMLRWHHPVGKSLHWIIVGGESKQGPDEPRPFDVAWARSTIAQCRAAGVACFVKQLGESPVWYSPDGRAGEAIELDDKHGGDWSEWTGELEDLRVREFPAEAA